VRQLELSDFDEWLVHSALYLSKVGIFDYTTAAQKREAFAPRAAWGGVGLF
jgi:hypothetical protein